MAVKKGLGRGLGALLSDNDYGALSREITSTDTPNEVDINEVFPNPNQPRKTFNEENLQELADSIKIHGIIQPIIVVKREGGYMIIAGERRWRAAAIAGLNKIPIIIKDYSEQKINEISLIENLQREDLNAVEAAKAIKRLMNEYNYTQEQVAERLGKSRPAIANTIRLLSLCDEVLELIKEDKLSAGHARALIPITDKKDQLTLAKLAIDNGYSVRDMENAVKKYFAPKPEKKPAPELSIELKELIYDMQRVFATKVTAIGNDNKGRIYIDYFSRDDLDRIQELLTKLKR